MSSATVPAQATGSHRIVQLDGLRGIAIAIVFVFHAFHVAGLWMGVDLFFVLSGFLITGILFNQKSRPFGEYIRHFYARRARRILPAYVVILIITGVIFGFGFLHYWYMLFGLMNFQGTFTTRLPAGPGYIPLWSLAVEEQFYFVWPVVIFCIARKGLVRCAVALLIGAPVLRYFCTQFFPLDGTPLYQWLPFRVDTLAAGALIALLWSSIREKAAASPSWKYKLIAAGFAGFFGSLILLIVLRHYGVKTSVNTALGNTLPYSLTLVTMASLVLLALLGVGKPALSFPLLIWLGRISFSFYLVHLTALYLTHGNPWLALVISLAYSTAMWFFVEKPIITPGQSKEKVLVPEPVAAAI